MLDELTARGSFRQIRLDDVSLPLARLLYQELVIEGGIVVTAARLDHFGPGTTPLLLCGTRYQLEHLIIRLRWQPDQELQLLGDELERVLQDFDGEDRPALDLHGVLFRWGERTYVVGVLNITPDSFSGDGLIHPGDTPAEYTARAVERARTLVNDGADILDVGGESSHPSAQPVDADTERARVVPVLAALWKEIRMPLSVDTYKAEVARAALDAGAVIVNDVWGLQRDPGLAQVIAEQRACVVINHNAFDRKDGSARGPGRGHVIGDILSHLRRQVQQAIDAGIDPARIWIDPGLGFGKSLAENLELLDRLGELKSLGLPILIGPSRKGFIGRVLGGSAGEREEGTAAAVAVGIARGADLVRVHNVRAMCRVARMADAIARKPRLD